MHEYLCHDHSPHNLHKNNNNTAAATAAVIVVVTCAQQIYPYYTLYKLYAASIFLLWPLRLVNVFTILTVIQKLSTNLNHLRFPSFLFNFTYFLIFSHLILTTDGHFHPNNFYFSISK